MHECPAVAWQSLHDEALTAEESHAELALKRDPDRHPLVGSEERIFLRDQLAADLRQMDRDDFAGIRCAEREALLPGATVEEDRHEQ